jgi:hypothetical protein
VAIHPYENRCNLHQASHLSITTFSIDFLRFLWKKNIWFSGNCRKCPKMLWSWSEVEVVAGWSSKFHDREVSTYAAKQAAQANFGTTESAFSRKIAPEPFLLSLLVKTAVKSSVIPPTEAGGLFAPKLPRGVGRPGLNNPPASASGVRKKAVRAGEDRALHQLPPVGFQQIVKPAE